MAERVGVRDVSKTYRLGRLSVEALSRVTLSVGAGEFMAIAGPSGSGKTTLLNLIGCLDTPTAGEIEIDGEAVGALSPGRRADLRARKLGFIFQTFNLIPVLTAYENVEYPLLIRPQKGGLERAPFTPGARQRPGEPGALLDIKSRVRAALAQVGLAERARHRPAELSGGQQQRVAIARALVGNPALVLADEPTANLDSATGNDIIDLMRRLNREHGTTFVFSTHDPRIMKAADRVVEISDGRLR